MSEYEIGESVKKIPGIPDDSDVAICPRVDQIWPTSMDKAMLDDCFLCKETVWVNRQTPESYIRACGHCVSAYDPGAVIIAMQKWGVSVFDV